MASPWVNTYGVATITSSTATITAAGYAGQRIVLNRAAGITVTLPAAEGTGIEYVFILAADATGNHIIQVANTTDVMMGVAWLGNDTAGASCFYTADTSDTITMDGSTKGGLKGARIVLTDIASGKWSVHLWSEASGTEASPFSAAV